MSQVCLPKVNLSLKWGHFWTLLSGFQGVHIRRISPYSIFNLQCVSGWRRYYLTKYILHVLAVSILYNLSNSKCNIQTLCLYYTIYYPLNLARNKPDGFAKSLCPQSQSSYTNYHTSNNIISQLAAIHKLPKCVCVCVLGGIMHTPCSFKPVAHEKKHFTLATQIYNKCMLEMNFAFLASCNRQKLGMRSRNETVCQSYSV